MANNAVAKKVTVKKDGGKPPIKAKKISINKKKDGYELKDGDVTVPLGVHTRSLMLNFVPGTHLLYGTKLIAGVHLLAFETGHSITMDPSIKGLDIEVDEDGSLGLRVRR